MKYLQYILLSVCILFFRQLSAKNVSFTFEPYVIPQMLRPGDPNSVALGITGVAYRTGVLSPFSNPAGLADLEHFELCYSHSPSIEYCLFEKPVKIGNQETFALAIPLPSGYTIGANFLYMNFGKEKNPLTGKEKRASIKQFHLNVAKKIAFLYIGGSAKYLYQNYWGLIKTTSWAFDLGIRAHWDFISEAKTNGWLSVGASVQNLGPDVNYKFDYVQDTYSQSAPKFFRLGIAGGTTGIQKAIPTFMLTVEYQHVLNSSDYKWNHLGTGLEVRLLKHLYGQIGYNFELKEKNNTSFTDYKGLTYGFGFQTPGKISHKFPLQLELAYGQGIKIGYLDVSTVMILLNYAF